MTEPDGRPQRRRRRPQRQAGAGLADPAAEPQRGTGAPQVPDDAAGRGPNQPGGAAKGPRDGKGRPDGEPGRGHGRDPERGWRELAGSSPSQVGLSGALRARDVARPTAEDLAAAERSVTVVRRHWQPPEA